MNIYFWEVANSKEKYNLSWDETGQKHLDEELSLLAEQEIGSRKTFELSALTKDILEKGQSDSDGFKTWGSITVESAENGTWSVEKSESDVVLKIGGAWLCYLGPMIGSAMTTSMGPAETELEEEKIHFRF